MLTDLEIIAQLEKRIVRKLEKLDEVEWTSVGYQLNDQQQVIGLGLYQCNLSELPAEIVQLQNLQELYLRSNNLSELPAEIGQLQNLQELYLDSNNLSELPAEIVQLQNLQELDLRSNKLSELPAEIGQLQNLQYLNLRSNKLSELPAEIGQLQNLESLNLESNNLSELPAEIDQLQNLQYLNLSSNNLSELPAEIVQLENLESLNLESNNLSELPAEIGQLENLESLNLESNNLSELPAEIGQLQNLQELDLDSNNLSELPAGIGQIQDSCQLYISNNPLKTPPLEIAKKGIPAIRDYFQSLEKEEEQFPLNEAKVLLVGQGGVGKTSLVNRLIHDIFHDDETKTDGINIDNWPITINKEKIRLNVWDFGGQEIMHATHQFFLTKRSLYLLVLDARQGENESRAEYWLKLIQSIGGDSPIIVVINKIDEHGLEVNQRFLQEKYPTIKGFVKVSCKQDKGFKELKTKINHCVDKLPHVHDILPKSWFDIKNTLEDLEKDFIPYTDYQSLCEKHDVTEVSKQKTLIGFLHDLGIVLNFQSDKRLQDTNVLNPEWVTTGVYKRVVSR